MNSFVKRRGKVPHHFVGIRQVDVVAPADEDQLRSDRRSRCLEPVAVRNPVFASMNEVIGS